MGAFFLYNNTSSIVENNLTQVKDLFIKRGFSDPKSFALEKYTLLLYPKILLTSEPNWRSKNEDYLFVCGTLSYKGESYKTSLDILFNDLLSSSFDHHELTGNYAIITFIGRQLAVYPDGSNIYNIYFNSDKTILSNSLLATLYGTGKPVSYDHLSIAENLLTGYLVGPDTFFTNIHRIEPKRTVVFPGIDIASFDYPSPTKTFESRNEALEEQLKSLNDYFEKTRKLADEYGVDSGITSGHDSRLNMAMMRKHWKDISFHSHFRKIRDKEIEIAALVCEKAHVMNNQVEVKRPVEMTEEELQINMNEAFHFFDGHVKLHSFYTEGYNVASYRKKLLGKRRIGVSGIAGEIYRNEEEMVLPFWNFNTFLRYKIVYNYCGLVIKDQKFESLLFKRIGDKIKHTLDIDLHKIFIRRKDVKKFLVHVFIPSCLGSRNNAENSLSFFLSPFTDPAVASKALAASNWLGAGYEFQQKLICMADSELASVISDYGYSFTDGEPVKKRLMNLLKDLAPEFIKQRIIERKVQNGNIPFDQLYEKSELVRKCYAAVEKLHLPIDLKKLKNRSDKAPVIIGIGYVLLETEKYNL